MSLRFFKIVSTSINFYPSKNQIVNFEFLSASIPSFEDGS